ncbi:60 kDa chaperonin 1 [Rickettsiales bacterium]|nr:60 kDa chaperonin 1 [Rickettsiales bacterium]
MTTIVEIGHKGRDKVLDYMGTLQTAIGSTMGAKGKTVMIQKFTDNIQITKDGVTVNKSIDPADPYEKLASILVQQVTKQTENDSGDGTTTAAMLFIDAVKQANKVVSAGMNPMDVKRGMDKACEAMCEYIQSVAKPISSQEEIKTIGKISANGDDAVGEIIADAMDKVGRQGVITVEDGKGSKALELECTDGMHFDRGYLSPYFVTHPDRMEAILENPYIFLANKKLTAVQPLVPLLEAVIQTGRPLLLITEDTESDVLATLVVNKMRPGGLKVCAVKAPGFGERKTAMLEDIAILTKGRVFSDELGIKLESVGLDMLGSCKKAIITKDSTTLIGGTGDKSDIELRIAQLDKLIKESDSDYDKEKLQERRAKLGGGVAVIKVGGSSEVEVKERKDRVDDALHATRAAVEEGIVAGCGATLIYARQALDKIKCDNEAQIAGVNVLRQAATAALYCVVGNAGVNGAVVEFKLVEKGDNGLTYNVQKNEYVDAFKAGILDPAKVLRVALTAAISVSSMFVTTDAFVIEQKEDSNNNAGAGGAGGMGGMGGF